MSSWNSRLFVLSDDRGGDWVSTTLPLGVPVEASQIRVYRASGPYMPLGFPAPERVGSASEWMATLTGKGFRFQPV